MINKLFSNKLTENYKQKLVRLFPDKFPDTEFLDEFESDIASKSDFHKKKSIIQILYLDEDVKTFYIPLTKNAHRIKFIKHRREHEEKRFSDKPIITTANKTKKIISLDLITKAYMIDLEDEGLFGKKPNSVREYHLDIKKIFFNDFKDKLYRQNNSSYLNSYTVINSIVWHTYLPFESKEAVNQFKKLNKMN